MNIYYIDLRHFAVFLPTIEKKTPATALLKKKKLKVKQVPLNVSQQSAPIGSSKQLEIKLELRNLLNFRRSAWLRLLLLQIIKPFIYPYLSAYPKSNILRPHLHPISTLTTEKAMRTPIPHRENNTNRAARIDTIKF